MTAIAAGGSLTGGAQWHRRAISRADLTGVVVFVIPVLLGIFLATGISLVERSMYGVLLVAVLPHAGPYLASFPKHPANLLLAMLFVTLVIASAAAFTSVPSADAMLRGKALAATALWTSIYAVVFSTVRNAVDARRVMWWVGAATFAITISVYLSLLFHFAGIEFGEVLVDRDGGMRVFGPLGDQVGFVLVLAALTSLVASRPAMFALHVGALFLTATRGAVLCLILGAIGYGILLFNQRRTNRRATFTMALAAVGAAVVVWLSPLSTVFASRLIDPQNDAGYAMRLAAVEMGTKVFLDNPVLGVGFNGFAAARPADYEDWRNPAVAENGYSRAANQYVQTATDGGIGALLFLVLFVIACGINALRVVRWQSADAAVVAAQIWLIAVLAGNLGALWLLSDAATGFFVFTIAGLSARMSSLTAPRPFWGPAGA